MTADDGAVVRNRADGAQIACHLRACDAAFVPPLSARVDVDSYAAKIARHAERFEAWFDDETLAGLVAAYCNDAARRVAFVTSVSVLPLHQGRGVASRLVSACIEHVRDAGFLHVELEVDASNTAASQLYRRHGFEVTNARNGSLTMRVAT